MDHSFSTSSSVDHAGSSRSIQSPPVGRASSGTQPSPLSSSTSTRAGVGRPVAESTIVNASVPLLILHAFPARSRELLRTQTGPHAGIALGFRVPPWRSRSSQPRFAGPLRTSVRPCWIAGVAAYHIERAVEVQTGSGVRCRLAPAMADHGSTDCSQAGCADWRAATFHWGTLFKLAAR